MHRPGLFVLAAALLAGCSKPPVSQSSAPKGQQAAAADPWDTLARKVKQRDADAATLKTALAQVGNDLAARPDLKPPPALSEADRAALLKVVPLSTQEAGEISSAGYSGLDAAYLADALYLHDAARSLDREGPPPADLARNGFDWACRQVYLQPWVNEQSQFVPAVPPTAALRRGWGSGLERAYVFLALLQQLGLDGCLVGPPDAADKTTGAGPQVPGPRGPDGNPAGTVPRGPFWAVGVLAGKDVLLFDPWAGRPVGGPGGQGVATLAQAKADPALLKDAGGGLTPDQAKGATVFLAAPVSGMSPRMAVLEERLKAEVGVRLAAPPAALQARFAEAAGGPPRFWHPPTEPFAYGRVLATFTPVEDGGADPSPAGNRLKDQYQRAALPRSVFRLPPGLTAPPAVERLVGRGAGRYLAAFVTPLRGQPAPRERIQRGQFQDANRYLIDQQDAFVRGLERLRDSDRADPLEAARWAETVNELYANLRRAQYPDPLKDREPRPESDPGVIEARRALEEFGKATAAVEQRLIDRAVAPAGQAEAAYLLALSKHEEAGRKRARAARGGTDADRDAARAAWAEAANAWDGFLAQPAARTLPARYDHAAALAAEAAGMLGKK